MCYAKVTKKFKEVLTKYYKTLQSLGKLLTPIQTKSVKTTSDIAVTKRGHLIYTDPSDRYVKMVQNTKISEKIRLMEFIPINICYTLFDDLLVMMVKHDNTESKVVRYSAFKETCTKYFRKWQKLFQ